MTLAAMSLRQLLGTQRQQMHFVSPPDLPASRSRCASDIVVKEERWARLCGAALAAFVVWHVLFQHARLPYANQLNAERPARPAAAALGPSLFKTQSSAGCPERLNALLPGQQPLCPTQAMSEIALLVPQ